MNLLKPYKTLVIGFVIGAFVFPMVKGKLPSV
jgi:ABC-type uncharacterized transport system permease subunit